MKYIKIMRINLLKIFFSFIVFYSSICPDLAIGAELESKDSASKVTKNIVYKQVSKRNRRLVDCWLRDLQKTEVGARLFGIIDTKLQENKEQLYIEQGEEEVFQALQREEKTVLIIKLNFANIRQSVRKKRINCLGELVKKPTDNGVLSYFEAGSNLNPYHMVFWHELIHLKHYLDDAQQYKEYVRTYDFSLWDVYGQERGRKLWHTLEEQRTVIGTDKDNICEFTLRLATNLQPRYAYQDVGKDFYEEGEIIERLRGHYHFSNTRLRKLKKHDYRGLYWNFDLNEVAVSLLNSQTYKDNFIDLYTERAERDAEQESKLREGADAEKQDFAAKKSAVLARLAARRAAAHV